MLQTLIERNDLTSEDARRLMNGILEGTYTSAQISALLIALKLKGETKDEIAAFAKIMREKAVYIRPKIDNLVDTCGTGGDASNTFNISTTAAFIAAGSGVKIAKHGNRSVSSNCGSADVLEQLGAKILEPKKVEKCIEEVGIGFMFAPYFHPAMKQVTQIRKELGVRTVFNILGPLTNPASAHAHVLGVFDPHLIQIMADILAELGTKRAMVVHSEGIDEIGLGKTNVAELKKGSVERYVLDGNEFGFKLAEIPKAASKEESARIMLAVLNGTAGASRDIAVLNAAAAIYIGGAAKSMEEGVDRAINSIDSGSAMETLRKFVKFGDEENEYA